MAFFLHWKEKEEKEERWRRKPISCGVSLTHKEPGLLLASPLFSCVHWALSPLITPDRELTSLLLMTVRNLPKAPPAASFLTWEELITETRPAWKTLMFAETPFLSSPPPSSNCLFFAFYMRSHEMLGETQVREQLTTEPEPSHLQAKGVLCVFETSCPFPARDKRLHEWDAMNRLLFHTEHLQSLVLHEKIKKQTETAKSLAKVEKRKREKEKEKKKKIFHYISNQ